MRPSIIILTLLYVFLCSFKAENWRHSQIGNSDGLSNSAVTSVFMDSGGFIWFGTWDGLNRYDGSNIKVFKPDFFNKGSISNNIIRDIVEDKNKNFWIVTEDGVNLFNPHNESFTAFLKNKNSASYRENSIHAALDPDSVFWCSKFDLGIVSYNQANQSFNKPVQIKNDSNLLKDILGIAFSHDGVLWTINQKGTLTALKKDGEWSIINQVKLSDSYNIEPDKNWFINWHNETWIVLALKGGGILVYNPDRKVPVKLAPGNIGFNVTTVSKNVTDNFVWGGTDEGRVFQLYLGPNVKVNFIENQLNSLSAKQVKIWSVTETKPDLLWIGTDGDGVHKFIMKDNFFVSTQKGKLSEGNINHNIVRAIYEDESGNIWIGTRGNGLNFIPVNKGGTRVFDTDNGLSNNAVLSLGTDSYGNILIGTDGKGFDMLEQGTGKILHFPSDFINHGTIEIGSVYSICLDAFGDLWFGSSGYGLLRLTIKKLANGKYRVSDFEQFRYNLSDTNSIRSNVVYSIVEGEPNILWIGTRGGGLYRLNTLTKITECFRSEASNLSILNNNDVLSLWKSDKQELWIGTSGGLNKLDLSMQPYQFSHYTERDGLPNNTIHAILGDKSGNIWVSTNKGLAKLDPNSEEIRSYIVSDGLQSNEFSDGASFSGKVSGFFYFGGVNGFDKFIPEKIKDSDYFPGLVITKFTLTNQASSNINDPDNLFDLSDSLLLNYNQNFFQFNFTTLNYHNKQKCEYAYMLENFDQNYIKINGEGTANYTNVPPGKYTFKVKCTNEDGKWNPAAKQINITILPPFWKTTVAYIVYYLLASLLIYILISLIVKRIRIRNKIAMERLQIQQTKEMQQYKFQFFTNIAHEFRTPLTLIMAPAAQLMDSKKNDPGISPYVKSIYNNSISLLHLINELIDFRKVETGNQKLKVRNGNLSYLGAIITEAFRQYSIQNKITLQYYKPEKDVFGWFDNNVIEKVLLNLISNAIKYTPENGIVTVSITEKENIAHIEVKDTGIGIAKEFHDRIFDRFFNQASLMPRPMGTSDSSGVGLSLTKSLVELHRATISLDSQPGKGSCFTVSLPLSEKLYGNQEKHQEMVIDETEIIDKVAAELIHYDLTPFTSGKEKGKNKDITDYTVLIVDDNLQLRYLILDILQNDYTVLQAQNGLEALEIIEEEQVTLVISDILMPQMDGLELCKAIKENIHTCHIPVILLTAKGDLEHRIEGISSGADSYIPKPFDPRHLKVRISKLIENREKIQKALREFPLTSIKTVTGLNDRDVKFLKELGKYIEENIDLSELNADHIAEDLAMSKTQLYRKVKALTGYTPHGYIIHYRLNKAGRLLLESSLTVSEIIFETGFNNRTYFYRCFKEKFGCSPKHYIGKHSNISH